MCSIVKNELKLIQDGDRVTIRSSCNNLSEDVRIRAKEVAGRKEKGQRKKEVN